MNRPLSHVPVGPTDPVTAARLRRALRAALDGSGPAVAPIEVSAQSRSAARPTVPEADETVPDEVAVVVRTSGSTGTPRGVMLDAAALHASASATCARLSGPGRWVLALPLAHVAGLQVLLRSVVAGTEPLVLPADGGFDPFRFAETVARAAAPSGSGADLPVYTSLVPTQLHRIVSAAGPDASAGPAGALPTALRVLRRLDAILLGGAAAPEALVSRARDLGLRVVTTYGMTETCGGCVYDGVPLDGVEIAVDEDGVRLSGPVLARGYLPVSGDDPVPMTDAFVTDGSGTRWFRTRDLGHLQGGRLHITGRSDDMVVTGGHKVAPAAVEAALSGVPGVEQVCVVGVPDAEWGQALTAVVVPVTGRTGAAPTLEHLRAAAARTLKPAAAPRHLVLVDALPARGPGKVDRAEVMRLAVTALRSSDRPDGT